MQKKFACIPMRGGISMLAPFAVRRGPLHVTVCGTEVRP